MLVLAATVVVLAGMRLGAQILNPILFAVVLSLLFSPIYAWLMRRGLTASLALLIMLVGLSLLFVGLFFILGVSISRFSADIASYTGKQNGQLDNLGDLAKRLGLSNVDLRDAVKPSALAGTHGNVLAGVADFLSNLFLILIILLFLLASKSGALRGRVGSSPTSDTGGSPAHCF